MSVYARPGRSEDYALQIKHIYSPVTCLATRVRARAHAVRSELKSTVYLSMTLKLLDGGAYLLNKVSIRCSDTIHRGLKMECGKELGIEVSGLRCNCSNH